MVDTDKKKVWVAMSGGVDSSVTAWLLQKKGYDVTGAFIETWQPDFIECTARDDRRDAMRVASELGIELKVVDCRQEYKKNVVDYMVEEYRRGRVPNPDVMCNSYVKFGAFFERAMYEGAGMVATGHYVQNNENEKKEFFLSRGVDREKDQSYFLWNIPSKILPSLLFPVGGFNKNEIRQIAKEAGLSNAGKKDSQGICFLGKTDLKKFLSHYIKPKTGDVLDESGELIGKHQGVWFYTIGERRGFEVSKKTPSSGPFYILDKDLENNTLTVTENKKNLSLSQKVSASNCNWFLPIEEGCEYDLQVRYRERTYRAVLAEKNTENFIFEFTTERPQLVPGQSLVVYDREVCVGGGVIDNKLPL